MSDANIFINGALLESRMLVDFEDGGVGGFDFIGANWDAPFATNAIAHDGTYSLHVTRMSGSAGSGYALSSLTYGPLDTDTEYELHAWFHADHDGVYNLDVTEGFTFTRVAYGQVSVDNGAWVELVYQFNSGANTSIGLLLNDDNEPSPTFLATVYVDSIEIRKYAPDIPPLLTTIPDPGVYGDNVDMRPAVIATGAAVLSIPLADGHTNIDAPSTVSRTPSTFLDFEHTTQGYTTSGANWTAPDISTDTAFHGLRALKVTRVSTTPGDGSMLNDGVFTVDPGVDYTLHFMLATSNTDPTYTVEVLGATETLAKKAVWGDSDNTQWFEFFVTFNSGSDTTVNVRFSDDESTSNNIGDSLYIDAFALFPTEASVASPALIPLPEIHADDANIHPDTIGALGTLPDAEASASSEVLAATIVVVSHQPFADNGAPPALVTDLVGTALDMYSLQLDWTNPTDFDFDHIVIMRSDGMPYAHPGDELLADNVKAFIPGTLNNVDAASAIVIPTATYTDLQDTTGRPNSYPRTAPASWYKYTPTADGSITASTVGTAFDTYLYLLADDGTTVLASDDDSGGSLTSLLTYAVTAGTTYYLVASGWAAINVGVMALNFVGPAPDTSGSVVPDTFTDRGLLPNRIYYYAFYTYDHTGNVDLVGADIAVRTGSMSAASPMDITLAMPAGSITIADGTPIPPPAPGETIYYLGTPLRFTLSEPAGVSWNRDLLQPPPIRPGSPPPIVPTTFDPAVVRTATDIMVEIWNETNTEKIGDLDYSAARQFLDEYNGVGSGTLKIPAMHESASLLRRDRVLRFSYKDIPDPVFASVIEGRKTNVVAEPGSNWTEVNGRGTLCWLEDAVVLPYVDPSDDLPMTGWSVAVDGTRTAIQSNLSETAPDVRAFNFGSRDSWRHVLINDLGPGSGGSDPGLSAVWTTPIGVTYAARSDYLKGYPHSAARITPDLTDAGGTVGSAPHVNNPNLLTKWIDTAAKWIWPTNPQADTPDGQRAWFRGSFVLTDDTDVFVHGTADNSGSFYIDGQLLFSTNDAFTWRYRRISLKAGTHFFQISGRNAQARALKYNPAGVIGAIQRASDGAILFNTNTTASWETTLTSQSFATNAADTGAGWHRPLGVLQSAKRPLNLKEFWPADWPDGNAKWIWGSDPTTTSPPEQVCYFRAKVWIPNTGTYRWFCTADDGHVTWVDGIEVASLGYEGTAANGWQRSDEVDIDLVAGWHVFAMRGQNQMNASAHTARGNPACVLGTLMTIDVYGKPDTVVPNVHTDSTGISDDQGWYANWAAPAWKAGDVLYTLVNEAKARGVTRLLNVTMDFNADTDSNGIPWTTAVSRTWDIGTNLLQVAFDLCELGVDVWMTADNVLHCAETRGPNDPSFSVIYGGNIEGYDTDETYAGASVAYTRTRTGWFTLTNETSQMILGGKREAGISLANTDSQDAMVGLSHRAIGAVVMANMVAQAQAVIPLPGSMPYVDAEIGNLIYVLNPAGQQRMGRLLSISITENEAGATTWVPEIEIWNSPFGDGVDPTKPQDPPDPNNPFDPSTWVPAAEDWTRFIPQGTYGSDYPRRVTIPDVTTNNGYRAEPSPSPSGATPVPSNSAEAKRPAPNAQNRRTPPNAERVHIGDTAPKTTSGFHLWVDTGSVS